MIALLSGHLLDPGAALNSPHPVRGTGEFPFPGHDSTIARAVRGYSQVRSTARVSATVLPSGEVWSNTR